MAVNNTEDMSRYDEMLVEVQALYDTGRDYEAMRLFGMTQYRMKDYTLADGVLRFSYETRNAQGKGGCGRHWDSASLERDCHFARPAGRGASLLTLIGHHLEEQNHADK